MLGNLTGNAFKAFGSLHRPIKWGILTFTGLVAVAVVGKETISLYVAWRTAPAQIEQANQQARKTAADAAAADAQQRALRDCTTSISYIKAVVAAKKANLPPPPPEPCEARP